MPIKWNQNERKLRSFTILDRRGKKLEKVFKSLAKQSNEEWKNNAKNESNDQIGSVSQNSYRDDWGPTSITGDGRYEEGQFSACILLFPLVLRRIIFSLLSRIIGSRSSMLHTAIWCLFILLIPERVGDQTDAQEASATVSGPHWSCVRVLSTSIQVKWFNYILFFL